MLETTNQSLDQKTVDQIGLQPSKKEINAQISPAALIYEYPGLDNVYIMESDLYGNSMPEGSCFLAFEGKSGMVGKHISVDTLKRSSVDEIRKMADDNKEG